MGSIATTVERAPYRLALRVEGSNWNAYMAPHGTLLGWVLLGSISLASLVADPDLEEDFRALMEDIYAAMLHELCGAVAVHWPEPPMPVPPHECGSRA